ncbi:hypothetical protein SDC9_41766 [bioreactor metagenome]|uniref:2-methylcitrate dehydratase n=1 Tax=bioreactor metagenome TaxID=1076179 RepID=A0A644VVX0_9ZZZZ
MNGYFEAVADYYLATPPDQLEDTAADQARRCLKDTVGCMLAAGDVCRRELNFIRSLGSGGGCTVAGQDYSLPPAPAAFSNGLLAAALELDDATSIGVSVHPGCCVIPAALAASQIHNSSGGELIRAICFGYELCNRLGLLATEWIRELGLFGPGVIAAPCAAAVSGLLMGLDREKLRNAFSISLSMSPLCPFSAFTDGADSKSFYSAWGVYLGMLSSELAAEGFTGPAHILDGECSLKSIFSGERGLDVPPGSGGYSHAVVFKDYSACLSVHAAMTAISNLKERESFSPAQIMDVSIRTYPYACAISGLVKDLNPISARVSLPFTAAVMLTEGVLSPEAFKQESLRRQDYLSLSEKVHVQQGNEYGSGAFSKRGCCISVRLNDGRQIQETVDCAKWGVDSPPSDSDLDEKFLRITAQNIKKERAEALLNMLSTVPELEDLSSLFTLIAKEAR